MAFPISPTNGQLATVNGITYVYASASRSWTVVQGNVNNLYVTTFVSAGGNVTATGNITGSYFFGNGSQLTGISASGSGSSIANGTTNISTASNGNANITIGGTSNVAVFSTAGQFVTGLISATGNVSGGNLNVTGNIVDTGALSIITGSNGNIALVPNGTGVIVVNTDIRNGQANGVGNIGSSTGYFNTAFVKATSAQYADVAEWYAGDQHYEPGTVLIFGGTKEVTLCNTDNDSRVAGIVSTAPAHLMNAGINTEFAVPVALIGRVPTKVLGPVTQGSLMVSGENGHARACATPMPGTVIGKAIENFNGVSGVIEILVGRA